jgi:hypothetical protein
VRIELGNPRIDYHIGPGIFFAHAHGKKSPDPHYQGGYPWQSPEGLFGTISYPPSLGIF